MQHPVSKLALLALLCLASMRAHGARPILPVFHLANFSHPLVIDNPYLDPFYKDMERWSLHLQMYFLG